MTSQSSRTMPVRKNLVVQREPVSDAFDVFTEDVDSWWPRTHHIGKVADADASSSSRKAAGGATRCRWTARSAIGAACSRGIRRGGSLLAWQITHEWGYQPDLAKSSEVEVRFTPVRGGIDAAWISSIASSSDKAPAATRCARRWTIPTVGRPS